MKRSRNINRRGITMVELVVAMLLVGLVGLTAFGIISFSNRVLIESRREFEFQFSTRNVLNLTSDTLRYATAVFTVPKSIFDPNNLTEGWDYIGINQVVVTPAQDGNPAVTGHQIVKYSYNRTSGGHIATVIVEAKPHVDFIFQFKKVEQETVDSMLSFTIFSIPAGSKDAFGNPKPELTITSEVESINSLQVKDWGTPSDPAVAVAFLTAERSKSAVGNIAMVLDTSGSMAWPMGGQYASGKSRINILKEEGKTLINALAQESNTYVSLVPFATSANNPGDFYNAKSNLETLLPAVDGLEAIGGTNTGDGLRRAYWNLSRADAETPANVVVRSYLIVLVDGVTTFSTVVSDSNRNSVTANGNVHEGFLDRTPYDSNGQIAGNGSSLDSGGTAYVNLIGSMLQADGVKTYVIGFSSIPTELTSVNHIAAACGAPSDRVFVAGDQDALNQVFEAIRADIINDLTSVLGPF